MSYSSSKNRSKREERRLGRKRFRQAERRAVRGEHPRGRRFSHRWGHMGAMKQDDLP